MFLWHLTMVFLILVHFGCVIVAIQQGGFVLTSVFRCLIGRPEVSLMSEMIILRRKAK